MPNFNPEIKNGVDSVDKGHLEIRSVFNNGFVGNYPHCKKHGCMLKVSKDGICRCGEIHCSVGCYIIGENK